MNEYLIDLTNLNLQGNVLDISNNHYDIIYGLFKETFQEVSVDYVECDSEMLEEEFYHNVIMLFHMGKLWTNGERGNIIKSILKKMKKDGELLLLDIDKKYGEIFQGKIIMILPNSKTKEIIVKDYNPLKEIRKSSIERILQPYFEIQEEKSCGNVYYIRAKRKGNDENEDTNGGIELKVHSHKLGFKISKGLYKKTKL